MRGFLGSAATLVFIFSLVTAAYTVMLNQADLSAAARAGTAVESARWAVEADLFDCAKASPDGTTYSGTNGIGYNLVSVSSNGNSSITNYNAGFAKISVNLIHNYAPGVKWVSAATTGLTWSSCSTVTSDTITYVVKNAAGTTVCNPGSQTNCTQSFAAGSYQVVATGTGGNGYSKWVTI